MLVRSRLATRPRPRLGAARTTPSRRPTSRPTHVTTDLDRLVEEVLASLAGQQTHNRALKLRAAESGKSLNQIAEYRALADPSQVDAVFDGEKFTATGEQGDHAGA